MRSVTGLPDNDLDYDTVCGNGPHLDTPEPDADAPAWERTLLAEDDALRLAVAFDAAIDHALRGTR